MNVNTANNISCRRPHPTKNNFKGHYKEIILTELGEDTFKRYEEYDDNGEIVKASYTEEFKPNGYYSAEIKDEEETENQSKSPSISMRKAITKSSDYIKGSQISGLGFDKNKEAINHQRLYTVYFADENETIEKNELELEPEYIVFPKGAKMKENIKEYSLIDKIKKFFSRKNN